MNLKFKKGDVTKHMDNEEYISEYLKATPLNLPPFKSSLPHWVCKWA